MHALDAPTGLSKPELYREIETQLGGLMRDERNAIANAANVAALLYQMLPRLNWAGFYFLLDGELVLGPFQGKVACIRIPLGKGVCGTAAQRRETQVVADVHAFPGHIACDAASRSEIVVPLIEGDRIWGVLDVDSPDPARFDADDAAGLETVASLFLRHSQMARFFSR
jgi:L-methionine (R)-S-oxide reductase